MLKKWHRFWMIWHDRKLQNLEHYKMNYDRLFSHHYGKMEYHSKKHNEIVLLERKYNDKVWKFNHWE